MSRKRGKKHKVAVEAIPDDVLAEGSGPLHRGDVDAISTVEDVVTTEDIATTDDVVTADDVVATDGSVQPEKPATGRPDQGGEGQSAADAADAFKTVDDRRGDGRRIDPLDADAMLRAAAIAEGALEGEPDGSPEGDADASAEDDAGARSEDDADASAQGGLGGSDDDDGDGDDAIVFPTSAATMDAVQLKHLVEALIFASDRPLTVPRLRQLTRVGDVRRLEHALTELSADYGERGLVLQQVSGGYQFRTRTQFSAWVQQLIAGRPVRLSRAQLETLAIIAYRQPITRPEIDDIRGVDSSATLKLLIDRMLIRVLGKREEVGRPILYGTTKEFLDFFSLGDLREMPTLREYSELTAESRKVMSDRLGIAPDGANGSGNGSGGPDDGGDRGGGNGEGGHGAGGNGGGNGSGNGAGNGSGNGAGGATPGSGDGASSYDDEVMASASAMDLADAVAPFLSPLERDERSEAQAGEAPDGFAGGPEE